MNEKWKETFLLDDPTYRFVKNPKHVKLWYQESRKYTLVDCDLYPTKYQFTDTGRKAIAELYNSVIGKKSYIILSRLSAHMKILTEHVETVILELLKILEQPNALEEDPKLKE
jgi:hypothetical protein